MQRSLILLPLIASLTACGGGSDSSDNTTQPTQSVAAHIQGELQAVSKTDIKVNGITIPSSTANIVIDGEEQSLFDQLQPGMMVTVTTDGKKANTIIYDSILIAPVVKSATKNAAVTVAGYQVLGGNFNQFKSGDMVEVSGYFVSGEQVMATYVTKPINVLDKNAEIEGQVTNLDSQNRTFTLGKIHVDYNSVKEYAAQGSLNNGDWIEVEGELTTDLQLKALHIDVEDFQDFEDLNDKNSLEFQGVISWISSTKEQLTLNQKWPVTITAQTEFDGITKDKLVVGKMIEVEGAWSTANNNQTLIASEVEFDHDDDQPQPPIQTNKEFQVEGRATVNNEVLSINGIELTVMPSTQWEDGIHMSSVDGHWVQVEGYQQNNQFLVTEIEPETQAMHEIELEGQVTQAEDSDITLWGYAVADDSLNQYVGKNVEVECQFVPHDKQIHTCVVDND
ncbi:DUF5666 domain-containing protein [Shewanella marina]|uniref:DUF5666 domain-containing protein n=1 Tax=Shewanella marina TaxID=487319 RepID=UPI00046ED3FA|nr:DUF5666 domain-containing protein [Shewanella marina]